MKNNVLLSIIISTKGKPWRILSRTLDSILSSGFPDIEIIVIDQNTVSPVKTEVRSDPKYADIIYVNSDDTGLSRGRNSGIKQARGSWLLFFDDDAIMPADTLTAISPALYQQKDKSMIYFGDIRTLETDRPYLKKSAAAGSNIGLLNFDSVCSIALLFNSRVILETGLFDEALGAGTEYGSGEESDMILRALRHGFRIKKLNGFIVSHPEAKTTDVSRRESYGMGTGALYKKHIFSSPRFFAALSLKFIAELLLRGLLMLRHLSSPDLKEYHYRFMQGCIRGFREFKK